MHAPALVRGGRERLREEPSLRHAQLALRAELVEQALDFFFRHALSVSRSGPESSHNWLTEQGSVQTVDMQSDRAHTRAVPRKLRLEFAGAIYHVTNRGDRRDRVFKEDQDRQLFLATLAEVCTKAGWEVHACCLLPDHFHCVIETPQPNLVTGMKWWLGTFTNRFNRRHRQHGHVFAGRYKALPLDLDGDFFRLACAHVHLNPARTPTLAADRRLADFPWSSFPHYLQPPPARPAWLRVDRLLAAEGLPGDTAASRREFERRMESLRMADPPPDWAGLRRGWYFGGEAFRVGLLARLSSGLDMVRHGALPAESAQHEGERIVAEELARLDWSAAELSRQPKTAAAKVLLARRLRRETTLPLRWIAARLFMGSVNTLRNALLAANRPGTTTSALAAGPVPGTAAIDSQSKRSNIAKASAAAAPTNPSAEPAGFNVAWD